MSIRRPRRAASPMLSLAMILALGLMLPALSMTSAAAEEGRMPRTVTVSATGQAFAVPDMARVQTGVVSEAATAREALSANNAAMAKLIEGLKENGIDAKDIQTSGFHLNPRYTHPGDGQPPQIDGYQATNNVEVTVRNLDTLGTVLDKLVTLGANQMNGIAFDVTEAETLRDAARKTAIANARRRAELYAAAAGAKVGKVVTINEGGMSEPRPYLAAARMSAEAVPVERGQQALDANVTVTWELD